MLAADGIICSFDSTTNDGLNHLTVLKTHTKADSAQVAYREMIIPCFASKSGIYIGVIFVG